MIKTAKARLTGVTIILAISLIAAINLSLSFKTINTPVAQGVYLGANDKMVSLEDIDFIPEPGEIIEDAQLKLFYERQGAIANILKSENVEVRISDEVVSVVRPTQRTLSDLPNIFWIQIIVGIGAFLIAGQVWALSHKSLSSRLFLLSGFSTLIFTFAAAIYTTRPLAIDPFLFQALTKLNAFGASLFGMSTLSLFLVYPKRPASWKGLIIAQVSFFGSWTLLSLAGLLPAALGVNFVTLLEMVGIIAAITTQFFITKDDPKSRAALTWLGLAVFTGAGTFISLTALPLVMGFESTVSQGHAFLGFLAIYVGLAAGLRRFKLFEVGQWAFTLLFYTFGAFALLIFDAALIYFIGLERTPAFGIAILCIGFFYLPLRDFLRKKFTKRMNFDSHYLISEGLNVAFAPTHKERTEKWEMLLNKLFSPLEINELVQEIYEVEIVEDGSSLLVPSVAESKSFKLSYPWNGSKLFNAESKAIAEQMISLIKQAESSREAYDRGVIEERHRVAQDLHDDIGARLLTGLHMADEKMKPTLQAAISDIREMVGEMSKEKISLSRALADIRFESISRLNICNIDVDWPIFESDDKILDYYCHKAIKSSIREIITNTIRHSKATQLKLHFNPDKEQLQIVIQDNGQGLPVVKSTNKFGGFGLKNMEKRITDIKGSLQIDSSNQGTKISIMFPY